MIDQEGTLKVSEIGSKALYIQATKAGTQISVYAAPELIFKSQKTTSDLLTGDIWSLGLVFLEMATIDRLESNFSENSDNILMERLNTIKDVYG